ncbi:alpha/beta-hydrolase family protein [Hoyosella sp. YIM 151337]|uniref:alpha/beta hydrolase n=1 Tax=Hoyosella sp. YIM 151337 TaxID=2992742 RepID=UPI0022365298|nr:alpha/beta-hydrolase family protein [Hoyosella sp. YIM 151337]MCW4354453.1 alpha/beta-hydrolase family protein [Hoyosella sp. YIM 151337]
MRRLRAFGESFHPLGLAFAVLFYTWSMSPSLLPRWWVFQGVASAISMAIGYGLGCLAAWAVRKCGYSFTFHPRVRQVGWTVLGLTAVIVIPIFAVLGSWWQENIREIVGAPSEGRPMYIPLILIAVSVAVLLVLAGRLIRLGTRSLAHFLDRFVPLPTARLASLVVVIVLAVFVIDGAVQRGVVGIAEQSAAIADESTAPDVVQPVEPERSGSPDSLQDWDTLGREGRTFVAGGPRADDISAVTGRPAVTPIRVYAGRLAADDVEETARLVVDELERTGGFDRSVLAIATTTGRGWVNANVAASLEYLSDGDSAIASMQYSFLPSALSFVADRLTPQEAGRALFDAVYERWRDLPEDDRPKLLVFGESLGSFGGQSAFSGGYDMMARTDGALWVGTPNFSEQWSMLTASRDRGSPEVLPVIANGAHIRFASDPEDLDGPGLTNDWPAPRIVYWQHASDPIVWWSFDLLLSRPDWLEEPLSPRLEPGVRWIPFVTFWQVTLDMVFSTDVPSGHGHTYGPEATEMWAAILDGAPDGTERSRGEIAAIREALTSR